MIASTIEEAGNRPTDIPDANKVFTIKDIKFDRDSEDDEEELAEVEEEEENSESSQFNQSFDHEENDSYFSPRSINNSSSTFAT